MKELSIMLLSRSTLAILPALLLALFTVARAEPIVSSDRLPATTPWDLTRLGEAPSFEWLETSAGVRALMYQGLPYGGKPARVFAWYATPGSLAGDASLDHDLPAVVLVHGGGGTAFREWAELWARRGYAAIAMDLAGYRPDEGKDPHQRQNRTRLPDGGPDQGDGEKFGSIDKPAAEQWPYHAVANVLLAHSWIRARPEVDAQRTAVTGISWGGYLTCIVAGVDNRFRAAVPVYGCGFLQDNSAWLGQFARMTPTQRQRWITLWDPSQYLPAVSMPILFVNGTNDFAYPLDSYMKSVDAVPGTKQICVTVKMPHSHPAGWKPVEIGLFIDHHLRGATGLPELDTPKLEAGKLQATCQGDLPLKAAFLHFTTDREAINKREWQTRPATIMGQSVTADAPPTEATAWFLTVVDQRDAIVSSRVMLPVAP
jgi:dienelactone hydrolase